MSFGCLGLPFEGRDDLFCQAKLDYTGLRSLVKGFAQTGLTLPAGRGNPCLAGMLIIVSGGGLSRGAVGI